VQSGTFFPIRIESMRLKNHGHEESHPNPSKGADQNTNNFAEAHAIEFALEHAVLKNFAAIEIRTDSKYCIDSLDTWIHGWQKRAKGGVWKNSKGEPIIHQQVFMHIHNMRQFCDAKLVHVKGHSGEPGNEAADRLAVQGAKEFIRERNKTK